MKAASSGGWKCGRIAPRTGARRGLRSWPGVLAVCLLGAMLLASCGEEKKKVTAPGQRLEDGRVVFADGSPQIASIHAEPVLPTGNTSVRLPGRLVWNENLTVRVYPPFGGRVLNILVSVGDAVQGGQPLATLASPDFGQAQADAQRAFADLALAEKNLARVRDLVESGVAPRKDLTAIQAEHQRARTEHVRASARLKLYGGGASLDQSLVLRSPIPGTVVERNVNPGQEIRPEVAMAGQPALFVITDPAQLWVALDSTERDLPLLRAGEDVRLRVVAYPDDVFSARIDFVSDFVDRETRTVKVRGSTSNPSRKLKADMYVTGEVEAPTIPGVLVPAKAIFLAGDTHYAFIEEKPGRYRRVAVRTSGETNGSIGVVEGVGKDDRVVVDGTLFLQRIHAQLTARERAGKS